MIKEIALFSAEEQREIEAEIEKAARRKAPSLPSRAEAARRGVFPLVVNCAALVILAAGAFLLFYFHDTESAAIGETGAVLGITERALIREIRRETNALLGEKDAAIALMNEQLAGVDSELARLDSLEALSDEQRTVMEDLRRQQDEYRVNLSKAQAERALIIAESNQKEAQLRERLLEQQRANVQSSAEVEAAAAELALLSRDREKNEFVETQLNALFSRAGKYIEDGQYRDARDTISLLKEFLQTPAFDELRAFRSRRESDLAAVNALSVLLDGITAPPAAPETAASTEEETREAARLQRQLAENTASLGSKDEAIAGLQKDLADALAQVLAWDRQLESLRVQNAANLETMESQLRTISALNAEIERLQ
ncbi:MAG: hypothetical protein LBJ31_06125 [Treponema sp.]|nr:hypothetical protein [Treponema sp.]